MKSNAKVEYNAHLDMTPYISKYMDLNDNNNYELYASIRHDGGYGSGHYIAYTKNPINGKWFLYNDEDVYYVDDDEVLESNSYILFYQKAKQ